MVSTALVAGGYGKGRHVLMAPKQLPLFSLWREHSPTWVKGQLLLGLSFGSSDLRLTFQMNYEDHPS